MPDDATPEAVDIDDQPAPVHTDGVAVWDLVIADMRDRDRLGRERYGTPLQVDNGRNHLVDAYQESLDQTVYLRAAVEERAALLAEVTRLRSALTTERRTVEELRAALGEVLDVAGKWCAELNTYRTGHGKALTCDTRFGEWRTLAGPR